MKLGKLPARPGAVKFKFAAYFRADYLPTPPMRFGRHWLIKEWEVLGNNAYGDCVWAGAAHETMLWCAENKKKATFSDKSVLSDYSAQTGFDPKKPETDAGTDMQEAASYRRTTGVVDANGDRHKIDSYVSLKIGDYDELMLATYLLGATGIGFLYPRSADAQFKSAQPWDDTGRSPNDGGHYVPCVGRNSKGNILVVTWGRLHAMTKSFYEKYCDEAIAYVSLEHLDNKLLSPEGIHLEDLKRDLSSL